MIPRRQLMQLDLFDHSRDTMLRNDVADALERREASTARAAWRIFSEEFPLHETLPPLDLLVGALEHRTCVSFANHDAVREARRALNNEIEPAALRIFGGNGGAAWLAPLWREMAQRAAQLAFRPDRSEDHAAALWLRAGDWSAANDAVERVQSWRRSSTWSGKAATMKWSSGGRCCGTSIPRCMRPTWRHVDLITKRRFS